MMLQMDYEPEEFVENLGEVLDAVSLRVEEDLERFKPCIESRGRETGAWRGSEPQVKSRGLSSFGDPLPVKEPLAENLTGGRRVLCIIDPFGRLLLRYNVGGISCGQGTFDIVHNQSASLLTPERGGNPGFGDPSSIR